MEHYSEEGIYLNRALIKELLIEEFGTDDEHASSEIYETLQDIHLEKGGAIDDPRRVKSRIRSALRALENEGMAENTRRGFWVIYSPEETYPFDTSNVAINRNRGIVDGLVDFFDKLDLNPEDLPDGGAAQMKEILEELFDNLYNREDEYGQDQEGRFEGYESILAILIGVSLNMSKAP